MCYTVFHKVAIMRLRGRNVENYAIHAAWCTSSQRQFCKHILEEAFRRAESHRL